MKKFILSILVLALLIISTTSCKVEPEENKVIEDEVIEDNLQEDLLEDTYVHSETPAVSPEQLHVFWDEQTNRYGYKTENGYLNSDGEIVIEAQFYQAHNFSDGLAAACREADGCLEYINENGETVLKLEDVDGVSALFNFMPGEPSCDFSDGVALVKCGSESFCIDKEGNRLNVQNPDGMYKCGLIAVYDSERNLRGYADIEGNIVIPCKYVWARDFEPQGVALVFSDEFAFVSYDLQSRLRGYINTKGEEIIPLEYYDSPNCGASRVYPLHREADGMIELYKDGYYYYFTYDGVLVEKRLDPTWDLYYKDDTSLTYTVVEPTEQEISEIHKRMNILFSALLEDYDSTSDNAYEKIFFWNDLDSFGIPEYKEEIAQYISRPQYISGDGFMSWDNVIREKDPLGRFGDISPRCFNETGVFDEHLYYDYCNETGQMETAGYNKFDADFIDWLIGEVWNGKVDHDTFFEFDDTTQLYYHDGNYYSRRTEGGRGGGVFYETKIIEITKLDGHKYELKLEVVNDTDEHNSYASAIIGMKQASNGFRFWSIYSIDYDIDYNVEFSEPEIPKELYDIYGESIINPEEDDYSYIRINFDESKEISGYRELPVGVYGEQDGYIDSNGAYYETLPDGSKISYIRDWMYDTISCPEGVDYTYGSPYESDLFMFSKDDKYGYLNADGEIVIEAQFYRANNFSDGLAAVCREYDGCLEYINENGETVLKLEDVDGYRALYRMMVEEPSCDFSDGVALIKGKNESFCIDKEGNRLNVQKPVGMHKQGRIAFQDVETDLYGFADKDGNIVVPAVYSKVYDFSQSGIALVHSTEEYYVPEETYLFVEGCHHYRGFIDTQGNVVIPLEFESPYYLHGVKGMWECFESFGIVTLYKQGYVYYYRADGTLLGKKACMDSAIYEREYYKINLAEYYDSKNNVKLEN